MTTAIRASAPPRRRRPAAFPCCVTPRGAPTKREGEADHRERWRAGLAAPLLAAALFAALPAAAQPVARQAGPRAECLAATRAAERAHHLPEGLLVSVALAESGLHAYALNIGGRAHYPADGAAARRLLAGAGAGQSIMAGCVQVNARVHARGSDWPLDAPRAADWAARTLQQAYQRTGNWPDAVRRWNGGRPATANRLVCRVQAKLQVVNPGSMAMAGAACGAGEIARVRRDGHLLIAQAAAGD
jgi:hypothetical protein